ncbi:MAG: PAS domain-containing hybrid sensor histidine kinase/response regulator, partial [Desulfomonilaceae bacterium]
LSCERITGYKPVDFLENSRLLDEIVHPDDRPIVRDHNLIELKPGDPQSLEFRIITQNGRVRWIEHYCQSVFGENGEFLGRRASNRDITKRKLVEEDLCLSNARLSLALEAARAGTWDWDLRTNQIDWSEELWRLYGLEPNSVQPSYDTWLMTVHFNDRARIDCLVRECVSRNAELEGEWRIRDNEKGARWLFARGKPVLDATGHAVRYVGVVIDITDRKRAEEDLLGYKDNLEKLVEERTSELYDSHELVRIIIDNLPVAIYYKDFSERYLFSNRTHQKWWAKPAEQIRGLKAQEVMREAHPLTTDYFKTAMSGQEVKAEITIKYADGVTRDVSANVIPHKGSDGQVKGVVGFVTDLSDIKKSQRKLLESELTFRSLFENSLEGIFFGAPDGRVFMANPAACEILGMTEEEICAVGRDGVLDTTHPQYTTALLERERIGEVRTEINFKSRDGKVIPVELTSRIFRYSETETRSMTVFRDISKRKSLQEALLKSEQTLNRILMASPVGIAFVTSDRKLGWANKTFLELFGHDTVEDVKDLPVRLFYASEDEFDKTGSLMSSFCPKGEPAVTNTILKRKNGETFEAFVRANAFDPTDISKGFVSTVQDISDMKKAENEKIALQAQLFQSQKMESLGTLVGGIAHDFNNMLQIISGYSQFLMDYHKKGDPGYGDLQAIIETSKEAADLVTKLLAFGQQAQTIPTEINLNDRIRELSTVISRTLPHIIRLDLDLTDRPTTILADKGEIGQLFMNLAINASEAMPDGGDLKVTTSIVSLDEDYCKANLGAKPGDYVMLSVRDTGRGMDTETKCRIFDPFFSTKQRGPTRGTGLGLSVVRGIAQQRGGHITCESEPGEGTEFKVYFPIIDSKDQPIGPQKILVVEDNEKVAELEKRALESSGYKVIIAVNGKEAIEKFQARRDEISLVILDLILPEKSGRDCLMEMLTIDPSVKVLIASGYSMEGALKEEITPLVRGFVRKPFVIADLISAVHGALENVAQSAC